jgi:uncharacterized protein YmfQ (DUF2313 family)
MSDPAWGQTGIYEDGANFTFPNFQTFTHAAGNAGQITVPVEIPAADTYFELHCITGENSGSGNDSCVGVVIAAYAGPNIRTNYNSTATSIWIAENGGIFNNGSFVGYSMAPMVSGETVGVWINAAGTALAFTQNGTTWNNGATTADILAGTGVIPIAFSGALVPFVSLTAITETSTWAIFASVANCAFTPPTGAAYLPANALLTLSGVTAVVGSPLQGTWSAANADPGAALEVIVNGGSPVATGGTNTGTGGVFTGPTVGSAGWLSAGILDPSNALSALPASYHYGEPVNAGPTYASGTGTLGNVDGLSETATLDFSSGATYVIFNATIQAIQQLDGFNVEFLGNDGSTACCIVAFGNNGSPTNPTNPIVVNAPLGESPTVNTTIASSTVTVTGTLILDVGESGTSVAYNLACNGLTAAGSTGVGTITGISSVYIEALDISLEQNEVQYLVHAEGAPLAETLVLSTATYNGGTEILSVGGSVTTALTSLGISTGGTFSPATSLTVSGSLYSATLAGSLAAGTHTVQTVDVTTSVESNTLTLVVAPETLTLLSASLDGGGTLHVGGTATNADLTALNISAGGAFDAATSLSVTGTAWSAAGGTLSAGDYTIQVQDATTLIESNTLFLSVSDETLFLDTLAGILGGTLTFTGHSTSGTSSAVDLEINGTWTTPSAFSGGTPFTGAGAAIGTAGTIVARLRDHTNTYVMSNFETLVVASGESIFLASATGTFGGALTLSGASTDGPPAALNFSLTGGAPWSSVSTYSTASGTLAAAWTASWAGPLEADIWEVVVQDADETDVVSNTVTLTVTEPTEVLVLSLAAGLAGNQLNLGGTFQYAAIGGLNVSLNAGVDYTPVTSFVGAGTSDFTPLTWTGLGPILTPGTYAICVQDASNPAAVSNIIDLAVVARGGGTTGPFGGGTIPAWTAADFFAAFQRLMPRGRAWPTFLSAVMNQCLAALMPTYVRVSASLAGVLQNAFPATTVFLIPEWQASLGLPDACTPSGAALQQQQAQIVEKFTRGGGQSVPYYTAVAALLGYEITIVESAPEDRTWTVHAPVSAAGVLFRVGQSRAGDPLVFNPGYAQLECVFNQIKPASRALLFSYP